MIFKNLFLQTRTDFIKHLRASLLPPSNLCRRITSSQTNSSDWVHHNQLFQRHPRLQILEQQCNKSLHHLEQLLCYVFVLGLHRNPFIMSRFLYLSLIELERGNGVENSKFGVRIFDVIEHPNIFSWNTMIRFFAGVNPIVAVHYYMKMFREEIVPDKYTFPFLLQADFDLGFVKQIHSHVIKFGFDHILFVGNSLLNSYSIRGSSMDAWKVFDEMSERDVVTWTSLISGLVSQSNYREALQVFKELVADDSQPHPNAVTIISTMSACGGLGSMDLARTFHAFLTKTGWLELDISIANSLIDAYAKCGDLNYVIAVFEDIRSSNKDSYSWTAIISAYGMHGRGQDALKMFSQMEKAHHLVPDAVTFVAILSACAHSGLVEEGVAIFESMSREYKIQPDRRHYGCVIDLLGRAGLIERAYGIVESMEVEPNLAILGSLLSSCRVHDELQIAKDVLRKIGLLKERGGASVLLSNMYAKGNEWSKVVELRKEMRGKMQCKSPGRSWIQIKDAVYEFIAGNEDGPQAMEMHMVLDGLERLCKM